MKKKESKATKAVKKNMPAKKSGRGGARPGAGRKAKFEAVQQISIDTPLVILEAMEEAGINNKTNYALYLFARDLSNNQIITTKQRDAIQKIADDLEDNYF